MAEQKKRNDVTFYKPYKSAKNASDLAERWNIQPCHRSIQIYMLHCRLQIRLYAIKVSVMHQPTHPNVEVLMEVALTIATEVLALTRLIVYYK